MSRNHSQFHAQFLFSSCLLKCCPPQLSGVLHTYNVFIFNWKDQLSYFPSLFQCSKENFGESLTHSCKKLIVHVITGLGLDRRMENHAALQMSNFCAEQLLVRFRFGLRSQSFCFCVLVRGFGQSFHFKKITDFYGLLLDKKIITRDVDEGMLEKG